MTRLDKAGDRSVYGERDLKSLPCASEKEDNRRDRDCSSEKSNPRGSSMYQNHPRTTTRRRAGEGRRIRWAKEG